MKKKDVKNKASPIMFAIFLNQLQMNQLCNLMIDLRDGCIDKDSCLLYYDFLCNLDYISSS